MSDTEWFQSFFGEDYFEIYRDAFPPERTAEEVDAIVSLLGLAPGARILDLACGHGRHAIPLANRGFEVVGFDLSEVFLAQARSDAEAQRAELRWVQGDMRELAFEGEFDAVINVFTSFGYFDDPQDDVRVLERVCAVLKPGGCFLLETLHRDGLLGRFRSNIREKTSNGTVVESDYAWDLAEDVLHNEVVLIRPDGTRSEYRTAVRIRSLHTLLALMREAGLEPTAWYGGLDGSTLDLSSRRLVLLCTRPN